MDGSGGFQDDIFMFLESHEDQQTAGQEDGGEGEQGVWDGTGNEGELPGSFGGDGPEHAARMSALDTFDLQDMLAPAEYNQFENEMMPRDFSTRRRNRPKIPACTMNWNFSSRAMTLMRGDRCKVMPVPA